MLGAVPPRLLQQVLAFAAWRSRSRTAQMKKSAWSRRKHCALAVVRRSQKFRPSADPFSGARDGQNLIS